MPDEEEPYRIAYLDIKEKRQVQELIKKLACGYNLTKSKEETQFKEVKI